MDKGRVQVPAVGMIVAAGIDALFAIALATMSALDISMIDPWMHEGDKFEAVAEGGFLIVLCASKLLIDAVIAVGAFKMMKLESYGFAIAAAILSIIPCLSSPCFVLGVPFGIWALFVLMDPEVKSGFFESAGVPTTAPPPENAGL
jgi:hypothetical protein